MQPVFLIGFMGSGKSTLGRKLAEAMNCPFVDTDRLIEEELDTTVSQLFAEKGEVYFRKLEQEAIHKIPNDRLMIVATGGGLPCFEDNMTVMNKKGITVYLNTRVMTLHKRLIHAANERPLLEGMGDEELLDFIQDTLNKRVSFYQAAEWTISEEEQNDIPALVAKINLLQKNQ